jgi:AcrR family transcriptional regulator
MTRHSQPASAPRPAERPKSGGPKWRRRAADRPGEILDAALSVFIAKGFAATKLDDVAAAAGISKGLLYRYFDNKAELFKAMVRAMLVTTIRNAADQVTRTSTAIEALDIFLAQMKAVANDPRRSAIPKLVISEAGSFPEIATFYLAEVIGPGQEQLAALIRRGMATGEFRKVDPMATAKLLIAPLLLLAIWRHTFARHDSAPFDPDAMINQHREILLNGLAADRDAKPAKRGRRSS